MKINKLNILFVVSKSRSNKDGKAPLYCRITYIEQRKQFAVGLSVHSKLWKPKEQVAKPPTEDNNFINSQLSLIKNKINRAFLLLQSQETNFTVEDIYNQYAGKTIARSIGLAAYYNEYLDKFKKLIGIEIKQVTWNKFSYILNDVKDFTKYKYGKADILLKELDYAFIVEFEYYLKTEKHQKQITINKALQRLKKVIKDAIIAKLIDSSPFIQHKAKRVVHNVVYLTSDELSKLEKHEFAQPRLERVRDMFVFCCYTGLAFNEMSKLEAKHIIDGFDGNRWVKMIREKTQKEVSVPLLPQAIAIIDKLCGDNTDDKLLPTLSNQKFNSYLKEIAEIIGVEKKLTHHIARKTFATTVLLYNDVPMEIVSELLGHSKMSTTQEHYGKIVQKKVGEHMMNLGKKLDGKK